MSPEQAVYILDTTLSQIPLVHVRQQHTDMAIAALNQKFMGAPIPLEECRQSLSLIDSVIQEFPMKRDPYRVTRTAITVLTSCLADPPPPQEEVHDVTSVCG